MHATTVGVDLAKNVFELAISEGPGRPLRRDEANPAVARLDQPPAGLAADLHRGDLQHRR